jgi:hypothetical protein
MVNACGIVFLIKNQIARSAQSLTFGTLVHFKRFVMSGILASTGAQA